MKTKLPERRQFIRIEVPLEVTVQSKRWLEKVITKNVSPVGMRFEVAHEPEKNESLKLKLHLPLVKMPISLTGTIVWHKKTSLEDNAPYDVGVEITHIDDAGRSCYLKYLCDLLYKSSYDLRA